MTHGFTCPRCGTTSRHPRDEYEGYCARCHAFTRDAQPTRVAFERVVAERDDYRDRWETLGRVARLQIERLSSERAESPPSP